MKRCTPTVRASNFPVPALGLTADNAALLLGLLPRPPSVPHDVAELLAADELIDADPLLEGDPEGRCDHCGAALALSRDGALCPNCDADALATWFGEMTAPSVSAARPTLLGGLAPAPAFPPASERVWRAAGIGRPRLSGRY